MKRAPRLFYLILILSDEERRIIIKELIDSGNINLSGYLMPMVNCISLEQLRNAEERWLKKHSVSSSYLWNIRNRAYWFIIDVIDRYRGSGMYISRILQLYRVETYLRLREGSEHALPHVYEILPPDRKELWNFFKVAWWYEYTLRIYGHNNYKYTEETIVDEAFRGVRLSYYAFKLFSAYRRTPAFRLFSSDELRKILADIYNVFNEPIPFHNNSILFFLGITFVFTKACLWDSVSQLLLRIYEWAELVRILGELVIKKYHIPQTDEIAFKANWHIIQEFAYNFPEMGSFTDVSFLSKHLSTTPLSLSVAVRKAWWAVMNGRLDIGSRLLDSAQKSLNVEKWPSSLKELYYFSMAWIYFARYKDEKRTLDLIKQLNPRPKSILNMLPHMYSLFFAIDKNDFSEVRKHAEALYRYSLRNTILISVAKAIRWLGRNISKTDENVIWLDFKERLKNAYLQQPWDLHLEAIIPLRVYVESKIKKKDIAFIDIDDKSLKWFSAEQIQQVAEQIHGMKIDTLLVLNKAKEFKIMLEEYVRKLST
ncbi:MAG: hypothetical protein GXO48_03685 [Chlorobi bacterium]|nr:hypothetical protein [Chlorobiota bacterium]